MTRWVLLLLLVACAAPAPLPVATTSGAIAIANLDQLLSQPGDELDRVDLLLTRARFLGDTDALERAVRASETAPLDKAALLRRARARAAVHRFADALVDLTAAERAGARVTTERAMIAIALGRPADALPALHAELRRAPGYAAYSALASAYAALGAFPAADALYAAALTSLHTTSHTTSPLPYAWVSFARGLMWSELAHASAAGERLYREALRYLPAFYVAQVHLAELEAARGDFSPALARLAPLASAGDPEALGLLGRLHLRSHDPRASAELATARARYASLLSRLPLAFADHAAELLLSVGDPRAAAPLARLNLANRPTRRAALLVVRAALPALAEPVSGAFY